MQLSDTQTKLAGVFIVVLVLVVGYVLWTRTNVPTPVPAPGQTLDNPLGEARGSGPRTGAAQPPGPGGPAGMPNVPRPGTADPRLGLGPSKGAPIPR